MKIEMCYVQQNYQTSTLRLASKQYLYALDKIILTPANSRRVPGREFIGRTQSVSPKYRPSHLSIVSSLMGSGSSMSSVESEFRGRVRCQFQYHSADYNSSSSHSLHQRMHLHLTHLSCLRCFLHVRVTALFINLEFKMLCSTRPPPLSLFYVPYLLHWRLACSLARGRMQSRAANEGSRRYHKRRRLLLVESTYQRLHI